MIAESRDQGLLEGAESRRLTQTLSSAGRTVADVVVPLADVTSLPAFPTVGDIADAVAATGFSRFPLQDHDRLVGYLHIKDVLDLLGDDPNAPVPRSRVRGLPEIPTDAKLDEALAALRRANSHLARAVRPDGTLFGVVALEDVVEEYIGPVRDATHVGR